MTTVLDVADIVTITVMGGGVIQLSLLGVTSTVGADAITFGNGTITLRPGIMTPLGVGVDELVITRSSISMKGTIGQFNVFMSLDRKRKTIVATVTNLVAIISYLDTVDIINGHISTIDGATVTVTKDGGYKVSIVVNGTIFQHDMRMYLGWVPHKYAALYLASISPGDIITGAPILDGISFNEVHAVHASDKVTIDREYKKGFHLRGILDLGQVHPIMSVVKVLLSSRSSMDMFIGYVDGSAVRPWNIAIKRMDTTVITIRDMTLTVGEASIKVDHTNRVTMSMEVAISFASVPELTLSTIFSVDVTSDTIVADISIVESVPLMDEVSIKSIKLKTTSSYTGSFFSIDALMEMMSPDRLEFEAVLEAWGTDATGSVAIDEEVVFELEMLEPMPMIVNMMNLSDIMPLTNVIRPSKINMYGSTKPRLIRLGGTVATVMPMDEYRNSDRHLELVAYILQEIIHSIYGQVTLSVSSTIDLGTPRNSNVDMTIGIVHELQLLGFTFTGSSVGIRVSGKPSVGIIMSINFMVPPHDDVVKFSLVLDASPVEVAIQMSMLGQWDDVLGIEGLTISDLGIMASKAYAEIASSLPALAVPGVGIGAVINAIRPSNMGITGNIGIRDPRFPGEEPFFVHATLIAGTSVSELSFKGSIDTGEYGNMGVLANRLHHLFTGGHPLDPVVKDSLAMITLNEATVRFVPTGTRIGDITINQGVGLLFRAMMESPIVDGIISLEGSMEMGEGITMKGEIPDIVIPRVIEVRRSIFDVSVMWSKPLESYIQLDAQVTVLDTLTSSTRMDVSRNGIEYEGSIHSPGGYINVGATVKRDPSATLNIKISNPMAIITDTVQAADVMVRGSIDQYVAIYSSQYNDMKAQYGHITHDHVRAEMDSIKLQMESFIEDNIFVIRNTANNLVTAIDDNNVAQSNLRNTEISLTARLRGYGDDSVDRIPSAINDAERQLREAESRRDSLKKIKAKLDGCTGIWAGACVVKVLWEYRHTLINLAIAAVASGITSAYNTSVSLVSTIISRLSDLKSIRDAWHLVVNAALTAFNKVKSITDALTNGIRDISLRLSSMVKDSIRLFLLSIIYEANVPIKVTDISLIDIAAPPIIGSMRAAVDLINSLVPAGLPRLSFDANTATVNQLFKDVVSDVSGALESPYERYMAMVNDRPYLAEAEPPHPFLIPHDEKMGIMNNADVRMEMWHLYAIVSNPASMVIILNYIIANKMKDTMDGVFIDRIMASLTGMLSVSDIFLNGSVNLTNAIIRSSPVTLTIAGRDINIGPIDIDVRDIVVSVAQRIVDAAHEIIIQQ